MVLLFPCKPIQQIWVMYLLPDISDIMVAKFKENGELEWSIFFGGEGLDLASSVTSNPEGDVLLYFTRGEQPNTLGLSEMNVVKLNSEGEELYDLVIGGTSRDVAIEGILLDNELILAGNSFSNDGVIGSNRGHSDAWISSYTDLKTSVESEQFNQEILIYPVPSEDFIHASSNILFQNYQLYNAAGVLVQEDQLNDFQISIDIRKLPSQIYWLHIETANATHTKRSLKSIKSKLKKSLIRILDNLFLEGYLMLC